MLPTLALAPWMTALAVVIFLVVSVMMILIVLVQRPQGGGLSGAFGASSAGSGQTAFGAKTGDALTIGTITIFVLFLLVAIGLNFALRPSGPPAPTEARGVEETETTPATTDVPDTEPGASDDDVPQEALEDVAAPQPAPDPETPTDEQDTPPTDGGL